MKKLLFIWLAFITILFITYDGFFVFRNNEQDIKQPHNITYKATTAYVINLDRSKGRLNAVLPLVEALGLPFYRISGVDGSSLTDKEIETQVDLKAYKDYLGHYPKKGMIGCTLSHYKAWKIFLESENEFGVFFEDDVSFDPALLREVIDSLENNKYLWDLTSFEISHRGAPLTLKQLSLPHTNKNLSIYLTEVTHAGAYILNRKAALALLRKSLPIKMPIDHFFTRPWEFDIIMAGIEPRIVFQTFGDSDIRKTTTVDTNKQELSDVDLAQLMHKATYKLKSYIIRFLYTIKIYIEYAT
jgi:glycosyl transferase family 25